MPREDVRSKGVRYVGEGRLLVELVVAGEVRARCRGSGAVHRLGYRDGEWWCDCPARTTCSHLHALGLVVAPERYPAGGS